MRPGTIQIREWFIFFLSLVLFFLSFSVIVRAEEPLTGTLATMDPRAISLGGAMRAAPAGTASMYMNPASISMAPQYHVEGMYQYTGPEQMHTGGFSIVDSVTTAVGAGLSFNYSGIRQPRTKHDAYDVRLALSGAVADLFYIGAMARYLYLEQNSLSSKWGPVGRPALPASGNQQVDGLTFDVGAGLKLGNVLRLGVVGYNLTNTGSVFAPIGLGSGVSLSLMEMLHVEADAVIDFTSHDSVASEVHAGVEIFVMNTIAIRGGYIYDVYYNIHSVAAGLGYVHSQFGIDLGFMKETKEEGRMVIAVGFKYFVS